MVFERGPFFLEGGREGTWYYWFGLELAPTYHGPLIAIPAMPLTQGGPFVATAQGLRITGPVSPDPKVHYVVTVRNGGASGWFKLRGGSPS